MSTPQKIKIMLPNSDNLYFLQYRVLDTPYTMSVKLGEVLSPDTNLYVQLYGEQGETSKIMLRPVGSSLNKFEKGRTYKFTVETVNIGKVQDVNYMYM